MRLISGVLLGLVWLVVLLASSRGITDEAVVSLQGDMPRYLMNGVYVHDLIKDHPFADVLPYTYRYYARYPVLSLGHHPLLLGVAEVPFYWFCGISVVSGKLTILFFMLVAATAWFLLIRSMYDEVVAFCSAALLVTTPYVVGLSRVVMSEIPTLALILVTAYFFWRYCESDRLRHALACAIAAVLSAYSKQLALFMFPVFFVYLLVTKGVRRLWAREVLIAGAVMAVLLAPLVPLTLKFSQANVAFVASKGVAFRLGSENAEYVLSYLWREHLTYPVLLLSALGMVVAAVRRDRRALLFILWIVGFYVQITYSGVPYSRFSFYWIPAFCLFAALPLTVPSRRWRVVAGTVVVCVAAYQLVLCRELRTEYADGYEQAATYVVQHRKGESVLFAANVDTGYFTFHVRKHDPDRSLIVLLADKQLATSKLHMIVTDRIKAPEEIYNILQEYGVGYVVLEDVNFEDPALRWLREAVQSDTFVLRERIPIRSSRVGFDHSALLIYEYTGYTPPKPGAVLRIDVPLMAGSISVPFDDLLDPQRAFR